MVLTNGLNGTQVECIDGAAGGGLVDSYNICVVGESHIIQWSCNCLCTFTHCYKNGCYY